MCLAAVQDCGDVLQLVPEPLRDREMCLTAVRSSGLSLEFVPEPLRDRELCLEAVASNGRALRLVPDALKDYDMCLKSLKRHGTLELVPEAFRDCGMCLEAVRWNGHALALVPGALRTRELCLTALEGGSGAEDHVPEALWNDWTFCRDVVNRLKTHLSHVPDAVQVAHREIPLDLLKAQGAWHWREVAADLRRDRDFCLEAARRRPRLWHSIPEEFRDRAGAMSVLGSIAAGSADPN